MLPIVAPSCGSKLQGMSVGETSMRRGEILRPHQVWARQRLGLFWIYAGEFPRGARSGPSSAVPFRVWGIQKGQVRITYRTGTLVGGPGDWLVLPELPLGHVIAPGSTLVSLALDTAAGDGGMLGGLRPTCIRGGAPALTTAVAALQAWAAEHGTVLQSRQMRFAAMTAAQYGAQQALLWQIAGLLLDLAPADDGQASDPRLRLLLDLLERSSDAAFPRPALLARTCGLSWRRIQQLCREQWDETPRGLHDRLRTRAAVRRLAQPTAAIKETAHAVGFASADRFSHWFKRQVGVSPQAWRRRQWT